MSTQGLLFRWASNTQNLIQRVGLVQCERLRDILYVAKTDRTHIFGLNLSFNTLWAKSYSNMTSFIGNINNTMIKLTIYFIWLMRIDEQITNIIPLWIHVFIRDRGEYTTIYELWLLKFNVFRWRSMQGCWWR